MYHTKRRYSATNKILKSCKRVIYSIVSSLQQYAHHSTSITGKIFARIYHAIHHKVQSLGIKGTTRVVTSIASIFFVIIAMVVVSRNTNTVIFADNSLNIKEVDDAYISLDGAILDDGQDFGARFAYIVKPWDTLETVANEFGVTITSLKSSNWLSSSVIKAWQELIISNVDGFIYTTKDRITIRDFAFKYRLDLQDLKELNSLQNDNDMIDSGDDVFVPLTMDEGKKLWLIIPEPEPESENKSTVSVDVKPSKPQYRPTSKPTVITRSATRTSTKASWWVWRVSQTRASCMWFVPWQCTCYAAQKRPDIFVPGKQRPFGGNARSWYNNAKSAWYSVGTTASVWAIAVMTNGWSGYWHVGIVIDINGDQVLIESMNYVWPYIVNRLRVEKSRIRWYIY
jgi:CHAP domain/LysM domain